jgi:hypothetical protein
VQCSALREIDRCLVYLLANVSELTDSANHASLGLSVHTIDMRVWLLLMGSAEEKHS